MAIVNHQGGSAKTTTAVCLATALVEREHRVLLVDLDPQGRASAWLGIRTSGRALLEALVEHGDLAAVAHPTEAGVDLVPCGLAFAGLERVAAGEPGAETLLRHAMTRLPPGRWDFAFCDCPPSLNLASVNALVAAQAVLVPLTAHVLSMEPLARLLETLKRVRERLNPGLRLSGLVACRVDHRTNHGPEVVTLLRERFGTNVYNVSVRENVRLAEAPGFRKPITLYAPHSSGAVDYRQLANEFEQREKTHAEKTHPATR
ncbi:MAG: ParA family protein [Terriglobia bacterium]